MDRYHDRPILLDTTTNGVLLRDERLAAQLVRCNLLLSVSVDGACKETFERIRPPLRWEALLEGLACVARQALEAGPDARFYLQLYFLAMRSNIAELPDVVRLAARYRARKVVVNILSGEHVYHEVAGEDPGWEPVRLAECCLRAMAVGKELGVDVDVPGLFLQGALPEGAWEASDSPSSPSVLLAATNVHAGKPPADSCARTRDEQIEERESRHAGGEGDKRELASASPCRSVPLRNLHGKESPWASVVTGRRCDWPWTHTCIEVNGKVHPCYSYFECLGNLREQPWADIWNGPAYRRFRRLIGGWNPNAICRVCPFPFGITGGDQSAFDRYFDRFEVRQVALDSPEVVFDEGFHALERNEGGACHRWMCDRGTFSLVVPSRAVFLRLRIFHHLPVPATNGGVCKIEGEPARYFDNSAPALHYPVSPGPARRLRVELSMEETHRVQGDERDLALGICGIEWLFKRDSCS